MTRILFSAGVPPRLLVLTLTLWAVKGQAQTNLMWRTGVVHEISIETKRTDPGVIRGELTFVEGDMLTPEAVRLSRENLYRLGLFRELALEPEWDEARQQYRVKILADDGWFFLPWPMFGARGGEPFGGVMLLQRNYFRRSEGMMLFGLWSENSMRYMVGVYGPRHSLMGGYADQTWTEYVYTDGAVNRKQFSDEGRGEQAEDFGTVAGSYEKAERDGYLLWGWRASPHWRFSARLSRSEIRYAEQDGVPGRLDSGWISGWTASAAYGRSSAGDREAQGGMFGAFGRIFGLGMAGVRNRLLRRSEREHSSRVQISMERGEPLLASDYDYTRLQVAGEQAVLFRDWGRLAWRTMAGYGINLPESRRLATGDRGLLAGTYAREYRGDAIAATTLSYSRPFFSSRLGAFQAEVFFDAAWCDGASGWADTAGAGLQLAYSFWRFPLPLGGGYTYSFEDENWQFSVAIGGMF